MADQAANNGGSQAAGNQFVKFTRGAAQRIAKAVQTVEGGNRVESGLAFNHPVFDSGSKLKVATFTGTWATGTFKTVTLTGTTQTASVYNWCTPVVGGDTSSTTASRYVVFGKASGTNSVVEIQLQSTSQTCTLSVGGVDLTQLGGYDAGAIQVLGHNTTGPCLVWYSVTTCATA